MTHRVGRHGKRGRHGNAVHGDHGSPISFATADGSKMTHRHVEVYRRLLESISHYSKLALSLLDSGAGDLPQWTNHIISSVRTEMKDVTHFLRGQASHGIRYGGDPHGRAYMATKNLREISEYADEALGHMEEGAGHFPAWLENKISICAEYMDLIGHWLENESVEGRRYGLLNWTGRPGIDPVDYAPRKYGSHLNPVPGDAGDEALYRGRADGIGGKRRNPFSPNNFQHKIYEQGFAESYGGAMDWEAWEDAQRRMPNAIVEPGPHPRGYGGPGGGRGGGTRGGAGRGAGGGGSGGGSGRHPGGGSGMGRGRGRRRRHRRNGVHIFPYWNLPYNVHSPVHEEAIPTVENVTPHIEGSTAIIILQGHGFNSIPGNEAQVEWSSDESVHALFAPIIDRNDNAIEIHIKFSGEVPGNLEILRIAYSTNHGELVLLTGPFSMAKRKKRFASIQPPNRMLEPHRMTNRHRMLRAQEEGRLFGVPGIAPGMPGWGGQAGVAQSPRPVRGSAPRGGSAPMGAVQTYGSLGYASMGDGSMDMAIRGARFAQTAPDDVDVSRVGVTGI